MTKSFIGFCYMLKSQGTGIKRLIRSWCGRINAEGNDTTFPSGAILDQLLKQSTK